MKISGGQLPQLCTVDAGLVVTPVPSLTCILWLKKGDRVTLHTSCDQKIVIGLENADSTWQAHLIGR